MGGRGRRRRRRRRRERRRRRKKRRKRRRRKRKKRNRKRKISLCKLCDLSHKVCFHELVRGGAEVCDELVSDNSDVGRVCHLEEQVESLRRRIAHDIKCLSV